MTATATDDTAETVIALAEEVARVGKRTVETGRVRVSLTTNVVEDIVRETLKTRRAEVERVPVGREVTEAPQIRQEGDVLIVPVVEEILIVVKRLFLKEEIQLRFAEHEQTVEHAVQRRVQQAAVERVPSPQRASPPIVVAD